MGKTLPTQVTYVAIMMNSINLSGARIKLNNQKGNKEIEMMAGCTFLCNSMVCSSWENILVM